MKYFFQPTPLSLDGAHHQGTAFIQRQFSNMATCGTNKALDLIDLIIDECTTSKVWCRLVEIRDVHFWQKYYSIFAEKYSNNIRKSVNQVLRSHKRTLYTCTHNDTGRGFYDLYDINLFISTTAPSTLNIKINFTRCVFLQFICYQHS